MMKTNIAGAMLLLVFLISIAVDSLAGEATRTHKTDGGVSHSSKQERQPDYSETEREKLADTYARKWLLEYRTATEITFVGKDKRTMKVKVMFQHNHAVKVIHDRSLIDDAKKIGVKRVEFHDWGNFAKEYIFYDIQ